MPEPTPITFLADAKSRVPITLGTILGKAGYQLQAYRPGNSIATIFMIFSPLWDGQQYQLVQGVWARFLKEDHPKTKMIVVGSIPFDDPNYIDLFELPADWAAFFESARPAAQLAQVIPTFSFSMDMLERLQRFLVGHGNESMADICGEIIINLAPGIGALNAENTVSRVKAVTEVVNSITTRNQWNTLSSRWTNYQPYFTFLPFEHTFVEINDAVEQLRQIFEGINANDKNIRGWFEKLLPPLKVLKERLELLERYVLE